MAQAPLIPANWSSFPDEFRKRLGSTVGRQRFMRTAADALVIAHQVPEAADAARRGVLFWRDAFSTWHASNGDPGGVALRLHLDRYSQKLDLYEAQEAKAVKADDYLPVLEGLAPIVRSIRNLLATLEEARKDAPEIRELIDHRDRAYDLTRQAELLYEDAKNSLDVAVVRRADQQAAAAQQMMVAAHRLNMLAAMFFPFATLGAVFGTTLTDNWSWSQSPIPFLGFVVFCTLVGLAMVNFVSKRGTP